MPEMALPQLHACRMRVAKLEPNGVPDPGAGNLIVTTALVQFTFSPVYRDGDETTVVNACGEICLDYRGPDNLRRGDFNLAICSHDPVLMSFLSEGETIQDGDAVGFAAPPIGPVSGSGISVELWVKRINDGDLDPDFPYARWALPKLKNLREGEHTFQNGEKNPAFSGQMYENPNWFDGPLNDWPSTSDRMYQWIPVTANDLPAATDGAVELVAS
jgi:hypothetical protein